MLKKIDLKFSGKVENNKFIADYPDAFFGHLNSHNGKQVELSLKPKRDKNARSNQLNRYYWGVVVRILCDEWGYDWNTELGRWTVHSIIKEQFLVHPVEIRGKMLKEEVSTKNLSNDEFQFLMTTIRTWASTEFSIYIPLPNEVPFQY